MARKRSQGLSPSTLIAGGLLLLIVTAVGTIVLLQGPVPEPVEPKVEEKPVDPFEDLPPENPFAEEQELSDN